MKIRWIPLTLFGVYDYTLAGADRNKNGIPDERDLLPLELGYKEKYNTPVGRFPYALIAQDLDGDGTLVPRHRQHTVEQPCRSLSILG